MVLRMRKILLCLLSLLPAAAYATVFDAADILPSNSGAISAMGEILLSDPTSEGVELHGRYGLSDDWNVSAILGTGTKEKNFRFGGQGVFNLLPDWEGQVGLSFLGKALYLRRYEKGGLQTQVGPVVHKRFKGWGGWPANVHAGFLWQLEARSGGTASGTQFVVGSDFDIAGSSAMYMTTELGIKIARTDSYILLGIGTRLGDLTFTPKRESEKRNRGVDRRSRNNDEDDNYTDEDFKK